MVYPTKHFQNVMPKWLQCTEHCWGLSNHGVFNCDVQYANFVSCLFGIDIIDSSRVSIFLQHNVIQCFRVCHCVWMSEGGFPVEVLQQSINFVCWFSTCWFDKFRYINGQKSPTTFHLICFRSVCECVRAPSFDQTIKHTFVVKLSKANCYAIKQ